MRALFAIVLVAAVGGCTSVKLTQRDGCWVRRTHKIFGQVREELGPCARTASPWSDDRLTRLVQECVAREDYRWQMRALAAWGRGEPMPQDRENVLATCASDAARAGFAENDALKSKLEASNDRLSFAKERLADVSGDRDALRKRSELEHDRLYASNEKLATALGEAAKKPAAPATATATASSDGRARLDSEERSEQTSPASAPVAFANATPWLTAPAQPATATSKRPAATKKKARVLAKAPECVPPATAAPAPAQPAPMIQAGSANVAPAPGPVVKAAEEKPAAAPATAGSAKGE